MKYPFNEIEPKWQKFWEETRVYKTDLSKTDNKLYCLVMLPYPSAAKMHIGHWYNYGPTDSWARFKKLQGYNVFEPMGFDAFGLPAENYAIKTGVHPQDSTMKNMEDIRVMLKHMGGMYDTDSELVTCFPEYYRWNQWMFLQMYKRGKAYRKNAPVNWCPSCKTVLAREQVLGDGTCERCGTTVEQKALTQWFFKIMDYVDELLEGLDKIDWPEKTKSMQRNWIGKSLGTEVDFAIEGHDDKLTVFTTRPDTLFGVTYVVLAPEKDLVKKITTPECKESVEKYILQTKLLTEVDRTSTVKEKTGVPTGAFAINPINGERVPIWIADYALATYGTGYVMAVPAHDERDFAFATKFNLPIRKVILQDGTNESDELKEAFTEAGIMINSGKYNGTNSAEGIEKISSDLEAQKIGKRTVNYRMRDWLISRQRYWGTPIPIVHCKKCGEVPVPEDQLPVVLPYNVDFKPDGGSPLAGNEEFVNTTCPTCGEPAKRDCDTMDTFVDSSWYYLRYLNPKYDKGMFDSELANAWAPVDTYVGGAEHAVMHLLYARFIHKFLRDIGLVNSDEPFQRLIHQGTITNQGAKMSKSKGNVVDAAGFTDVYGVDVFRMYLMFMGPYELGGDWSDKGIVGVDRFVQRAYSLFESNQNLKKEFTAKEKYDLAELSEIEKHIYRKVNQTLEKFSVELDNFRFNTAVASLMELINELKNLGECKKEIQTYVLERFAMMISPLAPHLGEECWKLLGNDISIFQMPHYFKVDEKALVKDSVNLAVQVNGKLRATVEVPFNSDQTSASIVVKADERVIKFMEGKQIVKEIFVPNKIYNIVVK
jgi:leucyl-tRNA synthetase